MEPKEERLSVSTEVLNKALNTLAQMPYSQVAGVIQSLQQDVRPLEDAAPVNLSAVES